MPTPLVTMVEWPWRRGEDDGESGAGHPDAVVVCAFQDGTIAVYEDRVAVERPGRSRFDDVTIPLASVVGVDYDEGLTVGYLQVEHADIDSDAGGLMSDPVNERTVHFGRGSRACARRARDAVLERATG
ncbi:MAG: hypothetical protein ABEJ43_09415 [Haloferacaceae archaeon]